MLQPLLICGLNLHAATVPVVECPDGESVRYMVIIRKSFSVPTTF